MPIPQIMLQPKNLSLFQQQTTINYFGNTFDSISQIKIEKDIIIGQKKTN